MATYTTSQASAGQPRVVETGLCYKKVGPLGTNGTTLSVGDVFQMAPVPHGAYVTGIDVSGNVPGVAAVTLQIGDGGSANRYGTVTLSATAQTARAPMPGTGAYQYSLSDDLVPRFDTIDLTVTVASSATVTANIYLGVQYYMPPA